MLAYYITYWFRCPKIRPSFLLVMHWLLYLNLEILCEMPSPSRVVNEWLRTMLPVMFLLWWQFPSPILVSPVPTNYYSVYIITIFSCKCMNSLFYFLNAFKACLLFCRYNWGNPGLQYDMRHMEGLNILVVVYLHDYVYIGIYLCIYVPCIYCIFDMFNFSLFDKI